MSGLGGYDFGTFEAVKKALAEALKADLAKLPPAFKETIEAVALKTAMGSMGAKEPRGANTIRELLCCPPINATPFDECTPAAGIAAGGSGVYQEIVGAEIPNGYIYLVTGFGFDVLDFASWSSVIWSMRFNNTSPIRPYEKCDYQVGGLSASSLNPCRIFRKASSKGKISIWAAGSFGGDKVKARIKGWFCPVDPSWGM